MAGRSPLVNLWLSHARGEPPVVRRTAGPPPHLQDATWRYSCQCGYTWQTAHVDAQANDHGHWVGPTRQCLICHRWIVGHQIAPSG